MTRLLKAVRAATPGGVLKRGRNNRSFYGRYHPPGGDPRIDAARKTKRAQSVILILNEKRPYTIVVQYKVEERVGDSYQVLRWDQKEAEKIKNRLEDDLASRPVEADLIDDFRAF